jgi:hypothetical protein
LLGRNFWPSLDKKEIENEVFKQFEDVMDKISKSNVTGNIRLHMVQQFIHAFLRWQLTIYPISVSWIDLNLTRIMTQYIKNWSGIMKKASPEILYISKQQGGLKPVQGFPDLISVFKQSQLTRADILSTSVDPLIKKLANREPRELAGTGWSAFQHRDRLIRLLSQKTENWEATPEHKRRRFLKQELDREEMKTRKDKLLNMTVQGRVMKETMTKDGNKLGWANSFINLSRNEIKFGIDSILDTTATPQRLKQWGVKDYRSGKHVIDDICTLCKKEKGTLGQILGHCNVALGKPKVHSTESHGGMTKFYRPQGRKRWNIRN